MPTIIDSLIVELRLDPDHELTADQRRAVDSFRALETQAQRSGQRVEQSGQDVVGFFRTLEHPIARLRRHFEELARAPATPARGLADLAAQGRRTGAEVEAGALAGAAGLRVMGAAGLGAFATITALHKAMETAHEAAVKVFGAGIGAATAGVPVEEFTAASQVLLRHGVPEAETQAWLGQLKTLQEQARAGIPGAAQELSQLQGTFQVAGVGGANLFNANPLDTLHEVAKSLSQMTTAEAIAKGQAIGLSAALAKSLHDLGAAELEAQEQAQRHSAVTGKQVDSANKLIAAQANLATQWERIERLLLNPIFENIYNWLAKILGLTADEIDKGEVGPGSVYSGQNGPDTIIGQWIRRHAPWLPGNAHGPQSGGGRSSSFIPPSGTDEETIRATVAEAGGNEQTQAAFLSNFNAENAGLSPSGLEAGVPGNAGVGGRGGASWAQWTGSRRRKLEEFGWTGNDPVKDREASAKMLHWELTQSPDYKDLVNRMNAAASATEAAKIAGRVYEQGGGDAGMFGGGGHDQAFMDNFHAGQAERFLRKGDNQRSFAPPPLTVPDRFTNEGAGGGPARTDGERGPLYPPWPFDEHGNPKPGYDAKGDKIGPTSALGGSNLAAQMAMLRGPQGGGTTHNYGDVNIGDVNVTTAATDAEGTGMAVADELSQRVGRATQANYGLV